jgi:hypothetical protein
MKISCKFLLLTALVVLPQTALAEIYKYVDENGVTRYTDKPPSKDAKPLTLPPLQTYTGAGISPTVESSEPGEDVLPKEVSGYSGIELLSPADQQVFNNANPIVTASAAVKPGLQDGHRVVFLVDGLLFPAPPGQTSVAIGDLVRGSHSLQAQVRDASDQVQIQSESINFHLSQPSLQQPLPDLTVTPGTNNPDYTGDGQPDPIVPTPTGPRPPARPRVPGQGQN